MVENILQTVASTSQINYGILRYFNVAGADPMKRTGQLSDNATHLIKIACETALGYRKSMEIYGDDYSTNDGTAVRDYIHVTDLVNAHVLLLEKMIQSKKNYILNCGYGRGYSVLDVINSVKKLSQTDFKTITSGRRIGDPEKLISDNKLIKKELHWKPKFDHLDEIIGHSLEWEKTVRNNLKVNHF